MLPIMALEVADDEAGAALDSAVEWPHQPQEGPQERRLAAAVGSDDSQNILSMDLERQILNDDAMTAAEGDVLSTHDESHL